MQTTEITAAPATRFYVMAGGLTVTRGYDGEPTGEIADDIRSVGGGWFRTRKLADRAARALDSNGIWFTRIVEAGSATEAAAIVRADETARLAWVGAA